MHATHNQGGVCPEPPASGPDLTAMTQPEFYHWATGTPACASDAPASDTDGYVVTDTGLAALDEAVPGEAPGTAAVVLRSAALYLERHGWIQGAYYDSTPGRFTPRACMVGAIGMACYGGPVDAPSQHFDDPGFLDFEEAVLHLDRFLMVEDSSEAYEFNDVRGRTVDQVTEVLRNAAARPADELIDALRVIDAKDATMAALAELLKPCGIWGEPVDQPVEHVDYPHASGTLYDCPACEAECFCSDGFRCVHCALEDEQNPGMDPGAVAADDDGETVIRAPGSAAQILRSAALYVEQHGWIQKSFYDKASESLTPRACMVGAIGMVCYGKPVFDPVNSADEPGFAEFTAALDHLNGYIYDRYEQFGYHDALSFNDLGSREALNVILVLREAADTADGGDAR